MPLAKLLLSEMIGTASLLICVVGSGILAHKLDQGNIALSVLCVSMATGACLLALISSLGAISAHFNPIVTIVLAAQKKIQAKLILPYIITQIFSACMGVVLANVMFDLPAFEFSHTIRSSNGLLLGEFIATFGLIGTIISTAKFKPDSLAYAVAAYVSGAILFTSSTCFANPAVTISRVLTNTLTGIRMEDIFPYIVVQSCGALFAFLIFTWLLAENKTRQKQKLYASEINKEIKELIKSN